MDLAIRDFSDKLIAEIKMLASEIERIEKMEAVK